MNQSINRISKALFLILMLLSALNLYASDEVISITTDDDSEIDIRVFSAKGTSSDQLLIGFACDQGSSVAEEKTSQALAKDGIEVWMPDMLSAYMLPKVRSSLSDIPTDGLVKIIEEAKKTKKKIYLIASGPDTELTLRALADWESNHGSSDNLLGGAILMFPRLNKSKPEPGKAPEYQDAVGKTKSPLIVLEGERTPNRWGIGHLTNSLKKGGSTVYAKLIPDVRGYFFKRNDPNVPEDLVTSQMSGLVKASLFFLGKAHK
ncbi:MAG: hypothetical protein KAI17_11685 [Thiotrichaceae bacterium]|nr:hypothetical protein [Thiotrichaceae bacterium]